MDNLLIVKAYCVYLPITLLLTYFVAKTLFSNGRVFMLDIFRQQEEIADSTNNLFKVGFYLINIGFALWFLKISGYQAKNLQSVFEVLSYKIGGFSIYLGIMLFLNLFMFFRGRRKSREKKLPEMAVE